MCPCGQQKCSIKYENIYFTSMWWFPCHVNLHHQNYLNCIILITIGCHIRLSTFVMHHKNLPPEKIVSEWIYISIKLVTTGFLGDLLLLWPATMLSQSDNAKVNTFIPTTPPWNICFMWFINYDIKSLNIKHMNPKDPNSQENDNSF